jgi:predicted RNA-binding protein with PUA-like domain
MSRWLFKEEPSSYNFAQLVKDKQTTWGGIANNAALKNLRQVKKGDEIFFYHTGKEKAVVGIMQAAADAVDGDEVTVVVKPIRLLDNPVPLNIVKTDEALKDWQLARVPRLSIMPVTAKQWQRVLVLSKS